MLFRLVLSDWIWACFAMVMGLLLPWLDDGGRLLSRPLAGSSAMALNLPSCRMNVSVMGVEDRMKDLKPAILAASRVVVVVVVVELP